LGLDVSRKATGNMNLKKKARRARLFYSGQFKRKIAEAKGGNALVGRELLSMAARQLKDFGRLAPDLALYIGEVLDAIVRDPTADARKCLQIQSPRPKHRPAKEERNTRLVAAFQVACEARIIDHRDEANLCVAIDEIAKDTNSPDALRETQEWLKEVQELQCIIEHKENSGLRTVRSPERLELAAKLFNIELSAAQAQGERSKERPATAATIRGALDRQKKATR
jgi:hypothetical protein